MKDRAKGRREVDDVHGLARLAAEALGKPGLFDEVVGGRISADDSASFLAGILNGALNEVFVPLVGGTWSGFDPTDRPVMTGVADLGERGRVRVRIELLGPPAGTSPIERHRPLYDLLEHDVVDGRPRPLAADEDGAPWPDEVQLLLGEWVALVERATRGLQGVKHLASQYGKPGKRVSDLMDRVVAELHGRP